ncbi:MAG: GerMN domain-containing protein, partial [Actinomycetota bacterium]|nr:GerMN domain-containing protein [Actinomycetota bacterium]
SSTPSAPPERDLTVPVYYLGRTGLGPRLFREFQLVTTPASRGEAALDQMLQRVPADPDYFTPWAPDSDALSVRRDDGVITVDLSAETLDTYAGAEVTPQLADLTVQQLVYTAQAALQSTDPVRILVEGEPVDQLFGSPTAEPVARADQLTVQSPIWITDPPQGATVGRRLTFRGVANTFEANVAWQVLRGDQVVADGATTAVGGAMVFSEWSDTVQLPPGEYVLRAYESSAEDGSLVAEDTKAITVE